MANVEDADSVALAPEPSGRLGAADRFSVKLLRRVGWGLLLLYSVDLVQMLFPLALGDPLWEFRKVVDLVQIAPLPLLALVLVFQGERLDRSILERRFLWLISQLLLGVAIAYLLLVPLTLSAAVRIHTQNRNQVSNSMATRQQVLNRSARRLEGLAPDDLKRLETQSGPALPQPKELTPEEFRRQLRRYITEVQTRVKLEADESLLALRRNLMRATAKAIAQTVVCSAIVFYVWKKTDWARQSEGLTLRWSWLPLARLRWLWHSISCWLQRWRRRLHHGWETGLGLRLTPGSSARSARSRTRRPLRVASSRLRRWTLRSRASQMPIWRTHTLRRPRSRAWNRLASRAGGWMQWVRQQLRRGR